jgi:hypothetical protein
VGGWLEFGVLALLKCLIGRTVHLCLVHLQEKYTPRLNRPVTVIKCCYRAGIYLRMQGF